jgi:hypothetical protein
VITSLLSGHLSAADNDALAAFEEQFSYPLGPSARFSISHCGDYLRFFDAMGPACCVVVRQGGAVLGAISMAVRRLLLADGTQRAVGYVGDLKIAPAARGGWVLARLAREAKRWLEPRVDAALAIVMDGTGVLPPIYTGRAGLPAFKPIGRVTLLRLPTDAADDTEVPSAPLARAAQVFAALTRGRLALPLENAAGRSEITPQALVNATGTACGVLEDTRRAKRLMETGGREIFSAHLSGFAYRTIGEGASLLSAARRLARNEGHPALFVSVASPDADAIRAAVAPCVPTLATATVFGANLRASDYWNINTSEI